MASKESKPTHDIGNKIRQGMLISRFLRAVGDEATELVKDSDGNDKMATKAEALARLIWKAALGYKEITVDDKGRELVTVYAPDRTAWHLVFDRIEGKVITSVDEIKKNTGLTERVNEQSRKRINSAGGMRG